MKNWTEYKREYSKEYRRAGFGRLQDKRYYEQHKEQRKADARERQRLRRQKHENQLTTNNMKKIILLLAFLPLLLSCETGHVKRTPATPNRLTVTWLQSVGDCYGIITDTKTGREYLVVHIGYGTAIVEIQPAKEVQNDIQE